MPNYFAIIAAAGVGQRFAAKQPKQYQMLATKTILEHSIESLLHYEPLKKLMVVLHPDDPYWHHLPIAQQAKIHTTHGGSTRADSVLNGLNALQALGVRAEDFVLVHDAARPYLPMRDLLSLIETTQDHSVGGILVAPVVDTLKFSSDGKHVEKTIAREHMYRALTPQCFRYEKLRSAVLQAKQTGKLISDESMALELCGQQILCVLGDPANIKITHREDVAMVESFLEMTARA